jgi:transcription antitermination factor NusG
MPSKEFLWFQKHYEELSEKYPGMTVGIVDEELVGVGATIKEVEKQAKHITNKVPFFGKLQKRAMIL